MGGSIGRSAGQAFDGRHRANVPQPPCYSKRANGPRQKVRWRVAGGSQTGASDTERAPLQRTSWYAGGVDPVHAPYLREPDLSLMNVHDCTLVIVPGHGNSGPQHWQTLLEQAHPRSVRVIQRHWNLPLRWQWTGALNRTLDAVAGPVILVGHSAGAMTIVHAASRDRPQVVGALLVAPPDMEARLPGMPAPWMVRLAGWRPIPTARLPWRSIVVASSNDPMCSILRSREFAGHWGSELVELDEAGHVNTDAGFGSWPGVQPLLASLCVQA